MRLISILSLITLFCTQTYGQNDNRLRQAALAIGNMYQQQTIRDDQRRSDNYRSHQIGQSGRQLRIIQQPTQPTQQMPPQQPRYLPYGN